MDISEMIARALETMFRCYECQRWLPASQVGRDVRWDEETVASILCRGCESDLEELGAQWPSREVA